jgi:phosphoribosylaminoimidazole-succinocarboxamide synthase
MPNLNKMTNVSLSTHFALKANLNVMLLSMFYMYASESLKSHYLEIKVRKRNLTENPTIVKRRKVRREYVLSSLVFPSAYPIKEDKKEGVSKVALLRGNSSR